MTEPAPTLPDLPPDLVTTAEAGRLVGVHRQTVRAWVLAGRLPAYRIGPRSLKVSRADMFSLVTPYDPAW